MKLLLKDSRVDPAANNNEAIRYANSNGHVEVVKLLLKDSRVDPAARNNAAIWSTSERTDVVKLLREKSEGANRYYLQHIKK